MNQSENSSSDEVSRLLHVSAIESTQVTRCCGHVAGSRLSSGVTCPPIAVICEGCQDVTNILHWYQIWARSLFSFQNCAASFTMLVP